jgi:hypothetical protein
VLVGACSGSKKPKQKNQLTNVQANLLSRVRLENFNKKNAAYIAFSGTIPNNGFVIAGKVDWKAKNISQQVALTTTNKSDLDATLIGSTVYEWYSGLEDDETNAGLASKHWVKRDYQPETYDVDAVASVVLDMAANFAENPLLIKQQGAKYLGREKIDDIETSKFSLSSSTTYWVDKDGLLRKFQGSIKNFRSAVSIVFGKFGKTTVETPDENDSYPLATVKDFYSLQRPQL